MQSEEAKDVFDFLNERPAPPLSYHPLWVTENGSIHVGTGHGSLLSELGFGGEYSRGFQAGGVRVVIENGGAIGLEWRAAELAEPVVKSLMSLIHHGDPPTVRLDGPGSFFKELKDHRTIGRHLSSRHE